MPGDETTTPEYYTQKELTHVEAHITRHFGKSDAIYHEIASPDIHVDIVVIPPRKKHNYYTLVTMGMGAHVMDVPDGDESFARAELLINLPPDWHMRDSDSDGWPEQYYWPIRWLKLLARLPGEQGTWLGWGHTIPTGDPLPGTNFSCMLLRNPGAWDEASHTCEMPDAGKLSFYQVVPLYEEEMEYKLDNSAEMLLELLGDDALEAVDVSRPNVCANIDPLKGVPFTRRIENFKAWFEKNERALAKGAAAKNPVDRDAFVDFVSRGTALLSKNVFFTVGKDREFTFSTEGRAYLFFLYPRLAAAMRGGALDKWTFHPYMRGSGGQVFELDIYGVKVDTDGVLVGIEQTEEDGGEVGLSFYSEALATLEQEQSIHAFYVLLDNAVGEGLVYRCVKRVARAGAIEEGMTALTKLAPRLWERINGEETPPAAFDPSDRFFSYTREVEEKEDGYDLRDDVFIGTARFMPLVNDYYAPSVRMWRAFTAFGAKPAFLYYYPDSGMENSALLDQRYDLQDAIEAQALGEQGSGSEIGLVLGGATGKERVYIDLLLYDETAFRERIAKIAANFGRAMFLSELRPDGGITMLFGASTPGLFEKLSDLHDAGRHVETADAISAIAREERSYEIQSLFARALNNIDRHEEALNILETIKERGETDPLWHFRVGYALYYLDREREAAPYFQRAIDLGLDDERTKEFLRDSLLYDEDGEKSE